jgi:hypothetical protein
VDSSDIARPVSRRTSDACEPARSPTRLLEPLGLEACKGEWRESTVLDYEWQLSDHLLPFFKNHRLSQITIAEVDR